MLTRTALIVAIFSLAACASEPNLPKLPADSGRLNIDGVSFAPPAEEGWYIGLQTPYHLGLMKRGDAKDETIAIEASLYKTPASALIPGADYVASVKAGEASPAATDPKRFTLTTHDVTPAKVSGATCARTHAISQDNAAHTPGGKTAAMILEMYSLNCMHPKDPRVGVNVTYSERYYAGQADPQLAAKATALLDSVALGELKE